jgi:RNA polymerase sigma-70 factor (ECF subfamily)
MISDDELMYSLYEGRIKDFEILINRYKKKIVNFIFRLILDYDEAQSLAQEVFLKVYENRHRYVRKKNFQAYIYTIAKNLALNHIKKQKRIQFVSQFSLKTNIQNPHSYRSPQEESSEVRESDNLIVNALKGMKENQRLALILKVYMDFSYRKISEITGWSIPKIETLIFRAKKELKNLVILQEKG